jgi:hypothetical protein
LEIVLSVSKSRSGASNTWAARLLVGGNAPLITADDAEEGTHQDRLRWLYQTMMNQSSSRQGEWFSGLFWHFEMSTRVPFAGS